MSYGTDDELSIAMIAFVEAIRSFDSSKGNFQLFAQCDKNAGSSTITGAKGVTGT